MRVFWSPDYVAAKYAFDTTRKSKMVADVLIADGQFDVAAPVHTDGEEWARKVHSPYYLHALKSGNPRDIAESQGFDWDSGLWTSILASTNGILSAVDEALATGVSGSLSSGLHHAKFDHGSGFCSVNGLVVAARYAKEVHGRDTVILDFDAHAGGGTMSLLARHGLDYVQHLDVTVSPFDTYGDNGPEDVNIVLSGCSNPDRYLAAIEFCLDSINDENRPLVIYNAGMDPYPYQTSATLRLRESMVAAEIAVRDLPALFVLAGGYTSSWEPAHLAHAHAATAQAFDSALSGRSVNLTT